jgi:hypothetical protein
MNNDEKLNKYRPSPDALLDPCHDEVFKALFTNESVESHTALRCFLTAVLDYSSVTEYKKSRTPS